MTRATMQVQIPRPCSAAWEAMTPTAQGRHCAACQLTVTDFTQRTDAEVLALLRQAAGGRVCGRFRAEQLNRELVHAPAAAPRWRAWLLAAATLLGLPAVASAQALRSTHSGGPMPAGGGAATQQLPAPTTADRAIAAPDPTQTIKGEMIEIPVNHVSGRVIDEATGEGLPGATVVLKGGTIGASTDAQGNFFLVLPSMAGSMLQISSIGYEAKLIPAANAAQLQRVAMKTDSHMLSGEVVITPWHSPRGLWYRVRSLPQRLTGRW